MLSHGAELDRMGSQFTQDIAYLQNSSRHRQQMPLYDSVPQVSDAWIAPVAPVAPCPLPVASRRSRCPEHVHKTNKSTEFHAQKASKFYDIAV